jgi:hypothetical protein
MRPGVSKLESFGREGWKMPLNVTLHRSGKAYSVSIIPFIGIASTVIIWSILVGFNPEGRNFGAAWFAIGIAGYLIYQKFKGGHKADG